MEEFVKRSSLRKHWDVLVARLGLALKENKEYKVNLWSVVLFDVSAILILTILKNLCFFKNSQKMSHKTHKF